MDDIFVREKRMPYHVRAFVMPDAAGDYNIYINDRLSDEEKTEAFAHEMRHIRNMDFYADKSAAELEENVG